MRYAATRLIPHLSNLPMYGSYMGILIDVNGTERWSCGHAHSFDSTARECADYFLKKRRELVR